MTSTCGRRWTKRPTPEVICWLAKGCSKQFEKATIPGPGSTNNGRRGTEKPQVGKLRLGALSPTSCREPLEPP